MAEEIKNPQEEGTEDGVDYIEAIKKLKETTVSKEDYEKLKGENKKLLESLMNGDTIESSTEPTEKSIDELKKTIFIQDSGLSNLEYWKNVLDLRKKIMESGDDDPFLPYGKKIAPTSEDIEKANKVAEVVQECIEYADGDSVLFTNELMRRTNDVQGALRKFR